MAIRSERIETKIATAIAAGTREEGSKTLAVYAVGLALTLLLNWYIQPYTLFWG